MKKTILILALLFSGLLVTTAEAQQILQTPACGAAPRQSTLDVSGQWTYTWQWESDGSIIYHGQMALTTCNGNVVGTVYVPNEITDQGERAAWNEQVLGTESGKAVSLMVANPEAGPWFLELIQTLPGSALPAASIMSGQEYYAPEHLPRGATFSATYMGGQSHRYTGAVTGAAITVPCAVDISTSTSFYVGNWNYTWPTGVGVLTGVMQMNQYGPWVWGQIDAPVQITPAQMSVWYWPTWWGIFNWSPTLGYNLWMFFDAGVNPWGTTDPWQYNLVETNFLSPYVISGTQTATPCLTNQGTFSASH